MRGEEVEALEWLKANDADITFREGGTRAYIIIGKRSSQLWDRDLLSAAKAVGWPGSKDVAHEEKPDAK